MLYIHLQNLCKQLYAKIDVVDEERYDYEDKVIKHNKDVSLNQHILLDKCIRYRLYLGWATPNQHFMLMPM